MNIMVDNGADALELGIPFSDPIADGPIIQKASVEALKTGITPRDCFYLIKRVRDKYPTLPIGLLTYANLVVSKGENIFYEELKNAGVDSLLIADVPTIEAAPFRRLARQKNIDYINILPPNASQKSLEEIAKTGMGYTYLLGRKGVTGLGMTADLPDQNLLKGLESYNGPPAIQGFGISEPYQVTLAIEAGVIGVISGSKPVSLIERALRDGDLNFNELKAFLVAMKAKTRTQKEAT